MRTMIGPATWFDGRFNPFLKKAREKAADRDIWAMKVVECGNEDDETLCDFPLESNAIYDTTKEQLEARIDELHQQAVAESLHADLSRLTLKNRRERGVHKLSAGVEDFLTYVQLFISGYSGIVEIVKAADQQFGGLAWGTLSVFLSIAARKQEREDEISRALVEFSNHFPRLKILKEIYPDDDLRRHIAGIFTDIIEFMRAATVYYQQRSIKRMMSSSNPKAKVIQTIEEIRTGLVNIRRDCETLMQQRVYELSGQVDDLKEQLIRMNASIERGQHDQRKRYLAKLMQRSKTSVSLTSTLDSSLLYNEIFQCCSGSKVPTTMSRKRVEEEPAFRQWMDHTDTGVLFLSGKNAPWINQTTLNWLSQATVSIAEILHEEKEEVVTVFCQNKPILSESNKPSIRSVFVHLALELLARQPPDSPRDANLGSVFEGDEDMDDYEALQAGVQILSHALQAYRAEQTVFILIDRVDQCRWNFETERCRQGVGNVLDVLLGLISTAPCKLKILVVSASTSHPPNLVDFLSRRLLKPASMEQFMARLNWDQEHD